LAKSLKKTDATAADQLLNDALQLAQAATNLENAVRPKSHQRITLLEGRFIVAKAMLASNGSKKGLERSKRFDFAALRTREKGPADGSLYEGLEEPCAR
jgi:hypothetical protein